MLAAQQNQKECVEVLLSFRANETTKNHIGQSAFDIAPETVRTVLNPMNVAAESVNQYIASGEANKLKTFLDSTKSEGLNKQDPLGLTPLMYAIVLEQIDCIGVLLELGADQSIVDKMGCTAYDRASEEIREKFPKLIEEHCTNRLRLPFSLPQFTIYGETGDRKESKVMIDVEQTRDRGNASLLYGSFRSYRGVIEDVIVKLKTDARSLDSEASLYSRFRQSPNPGIFFTCFNQQKMYLVLEDAGQDLRSIYGANEKIRSSVLVPQIIDALYYLHQMKIVHGDLKPENILVKEKNFQFTCKLCDFDSAVDEGRPFPRTPENNLKFSFDWVCPEIFMAFDQERSSKTRLDIFASLQMDIFSLGLIIDLLCRPHLTPDETVLPPIRSDTKTNVNLKRVLQSERELHSLIHCMRTNRSYAPLIQQMISIDPINRGSLDKYREELQNFSRTGFYRKTQEQEKFAVEKGHFFNNFLDELKKQQSHSNLSSALQVEYLESKFKEMVESIRTDIRGLDNRLTHTSLETIKEIQKSLQEVNTELKDHTDKRLTDTIIVLQSRMETMEKKVSDEVSLAGNLHATLLNQMNLQLVDLSTMSQQNNSSFIDLHTRLIKQQDHLNNIATDLLASYRDIVTNNNDIQLKLITIEKVTKETSEGFGAAVSSVTCREEFTTLCDQLKSYMEEKVLTLLSQVQNDTPVEGNNNLLAIQEQLAQLQRMATEDRDTKEKLENGQTQLLTAIQEMDNKLSAEMENLKGKVSNIRAEIIDELTERLQDQSTELENKWERSVEDIEAMIDKVVEKFQSSSNELQASTKNNLLQENELRNLIQATHDQIQAVRTFQDLSAFDAQNHPLLFMVSDEKIKDGIINEFVDAATRVIRKSYRVNFLCHVCGKVAPSGRHSEKENRRLWSRVKDSLSQVDRDQTGYRLVITNQWVLEFAEGMKWVLMAIQLAGRLSGLPIPQIAELIDDIVPIPQEIIHIVDEVQTKMKDICDGISKVIPKDIPAGGVDIDDIDAEDSVGLSASERQKLKETRAASQKAADNSADNQLSEEDRQALLEKQVQEYWDKYKPKITLDHVK